MYPPARIRCSDRIQLLRYVPGTSLLYKIFCTMYNVHEVRDKIKRIKTEEKAKVVAAAWGTEMIQFHATLAVLHQEAFKNR